MAGKRELLNGIVNRIARVGIELEGGWDAPVPGEQVIRDGSLRFAMPPAPRQQRWPQLTVDPATGQHILAFREEAPQPQRPTYPMYAIGEIVSPKGGMLIADIEPWMRKCYPQHVNETCGLHVHMSFYYKLNYSRLMCPEFTPYMVEALKSWAEKENLRKDHPQWRRFDPNDHWTKQHCSHLFLGDKQSQMKKKDYNSRGTDYSRYTFINYCEAQHHTVEVRGMSMPDTVDQAIRSVMTVLDTTNRFLSKTRQRERGTQVLVTERPIIYREFSSIVD